MSFKLEPKSGLFSFCPVRASVHALAIVFFISSSPSSYMFCRSTQILIRMREMQKLEPGSNAEPHTLLHKSVTDMTHMNLISWKWWKTLSVHFKYYWLHYLHQTHKACHWISVLLHRWWWFNLHKPKNCMLKSCWHLKENGSSMNIWYVKETLGKLPPLPLLHIRSYTTSFMLK